MEVKMEENKKQSLRKVGRTSFNVLDVIIIIAVLFVIAAIVVAVIPQFNISAINGEAVRITYTVIFKNVDESVYDKINANENVTETVTGALVGVVAEAPELELSYEYVVTDENGNDVAKKNYSDGLGMDVTVTITANAIYKEGIGYTVDGYRIAAGKEMSLRFSDFSCVGYCESLSVVGEG